MRSRCMSPQPNGFKMYRPTAKWQNVGTPKASCKLRIGLSHKLVVVMLGKTMTTAGLC